MPHSLHLSIIIPLYNQELYIAEAIDSVLKQKIDGLEILIINDGSTDNSIEIVNEYTKTHTHVYCLNNKRKKGVSGARNTGIDQAKGKWLLFLDSDDFLAKNALSNLLAFENDSFAPAVISGDYSFTDTLSTINKKQFYFSKKHIQKALSIKNNQEPIYLKQAVSDFLKSDMCIQTGTTLFKKELIDRVGYFNEAMSNSEDTDYWYRLLINERMILLPDIVLHHRLHPNNTIKNLENVHKGAIQCYEGLLTNPAFAQYTTLIKKRLVASLIDQTFFYRNIKKFSFATRVSYRVIGLAFTNKTAWKNLLASFLHIS